MLRGLIFDFDGTIAETERLGHRLAYNAAFRELGLPWEWDEVLYGDLLAVGGGKERLVHYVKHYQDGKLASSTLGDVISRIHEAKPRHFAALTPTIALRPGIVRIVREAKHARVKLAIATTAALGGVQALLALHPDLSDAFALVAAGDIVVKKKPDPAVYEHVLKTMKWRAHDVVAIEDAAIGLRAARAAGIATLVATSDYTSGEDFTGAAAVVSSLGDPASPAVATAGPEPVGGIIDLAYLDRLR